MEYLTIRIALLIFIAVVLLGTYWTGYRAADYAATWESWFVATLGGVVLGAVWLISDIP